jgi:hypothetical protein
MCPDDNLLRQMYQFWAALDEAMLAPGDIFRDPDCWPWNSPRPAVRAAWDRLTHPDNLLGMEHWLAHHRKGRGMTEWAKQVTLTAIEVCQRRSEESAS